MTQKEKSQVQIEEDVIRKVGTLFENVLSRQPPQNIIELWKENVEIRKIMTEVAELQNKIGDTNKRLAQQTRSPEAIKAFLTWADQIGIARNNVDIVESKDHIAVKVPRHAMLSLDLAKKSSIMKKAFEQDPLIGGMGNVGLALFLATQWINKEQSKWHAYISVLPNTFTTPIFYTEEQLLQLKPSPIFEETLMFYRTICRQFAYFLISISKNRAFENLQKTKGDSSIAPPPLYNTPFNVSNFTLGLYMWACGVVTTRVNMVPSETEKTEKGEVIMTPALIPVLDMANHETLEIDDQPEDLVCFSPDENCALVTCHSDVNPGDAVTIFYGKRSHGEHLLHNGFVPASHNTFDIYKLKIGIPKSDKDLEAKRKLIGELAPDVCCTGNVFHFVIINYPKKPFSEDIQVFASIFVTANPNKENIKSIESRKKGLEFIRNRLMILEKSYENSPRDPKTLALIGYAGDIARLKSSEAHILRIARIHCENLEKSI
ncbi:unnamed protein product [Caenorhabditis bovis]|uniref:protein-histidine N-methyltransferase n=1 Tax=Caenorhabditis bovis TaxID=2654633 RepID=A0A8S1ENF5_9PELO|nr:unnamed protein product [Caenorhabditis bovis]